MQIGIDSFVAAMGEDGAAVQARRADVMGSIERLGDKVAPRLRNR